MQLHGAWPDALDEARAGLRAALPTAGQPAVGAAFYQLAELHRLRGEFAQAEEAYRQASQWGRSRSPAWRCCGWPRVRSMPRRRRSAAWWTRRGTASTRSRLLPAYVEIMLAAGDVAAARAAADELSEIAADLDAPLLRALAAHATGAVLLGRGRRARPRWPRCAARGRPGRSSRRPTRPRASGC